MVKVILNLGNGNLQEDGFPTVVVQKLSDDGKILENLTTNLPANPELATLHHQWQEKYRSYFEHLNDTRLTIDEDEADRESLIVSEEQKRIALEELTTAGRNLTASLNHWLDFDPFYRPICQNLFCNLSNRETIQVAIETECQQLRKLPWHLCQIAQHTNIEFALSSINFQRIPNIQSFFLKRNINLLFLKSNSDGLKTDVDKKIWQKFPGINTIYSENLTRNELKTIIRERPIDIVYCAGHSSQGELEIEIDEGRDRFTLEEIKEDIKFAIQNSLQLCFFNTCNGLDIAPQLEPLNIPIQIVMKEIVPDEVARFFLKDFLDNLSRGKPVYLSVRSARKKLEKELDRKYPFSSWLPILCMNPSVEIDDRDKPKEKLTNGFYRISTLVILSSCLTFLAIGSNFIAKQANQLGIEFHKKDRLQSASFLYKISTFFDPKFAQPFYNSGWIQKEIGDRDRAIESYRKAALRGLPEGYAEASRLQILDGDYPGALTAIRQCLQRTEFDGVRAACLKNKGWAYIEQQRYEEAETVLQEAIYLKGEYSHAQCLLSESIERQGKFDRALDSWKKTKHQINALEVNKRLPEHDRCEAMAKQQLGE